MALQPGAVFAGYTIERMLGAGGMGEVYVARHPRLPRSDALKVLLPQFAADPQFRARFEREADLAAGLVHPAIVRVYDRGEFDGHLWIAMELVDGEDLAHVAAASGRLPADRVAAVVSEVAAALDMANATGLVHRDVKPANIMLSASGRVLLGDFGIARMGAESSDLTGTGIAVGTLNYASPEQLQGLQLDGRSDQYSLGCTAFQLLTGAAPYAATNAAVVMAGHLGQPLPSVRTARPGLPASVDAVLARATAKSPGERYPSSAAFAADLTQALAGANEPAPLPDGAGAPGAADGDPTLVRSAVPSTIAPDAATVVRGAPTQAPPAQVEAREASGAARNRRPLLIGGTVTLAVVLAIVGVIAFGGGGGQSSGDGYDGAVSPEAAKLTPLLASPLMPALTAAPAQSRWTFQAPNPRAGATFVGGDDTRVLVTYQVSRGDEKVNTLDVLDANTGKSQVSIPVPGASGVSSCALTGQVAMCGVSDPSGLIRVDLVSRIATRIKQPIDAVIGFQPAASNGVFLAKDAMKGSAVLRPDGSTAWTIPWDAYAVAGGPAAGVIAVTMKTTSADPLVPAKETTTLRRITDGTVLAELPATGSARSGWAAYQGGFAVKRDATIEFFASDGTRRGALSGSGALLTLVPTVDVAPSLPLVEPNGQADTVAAVNPDTGTLLWTRQVDKDVVRATTSPDYTAFGRQLVIGYRNGGPYWVVDLYTAASGRLGDGSTKIKSLLGTDGTCIVTTGDYGSVAALKPNGYCWSANFRTASGDAAELRVLGAGVYVGDLTSPALVRGV
ncbi:serine/threonine-protein kinase [Tsukamurella sp. NPDC003166]|uniref:serine/threonine-protein kinase n=1 Tax=Tsukamurella sp. NPDC003166 TaxID=3154444 RepID=UPI0033BA9874